MSRLTEICPDFSEWPERWMGTERDLDYGKQLLEAMRPFAEFLAECGLAKNTIKRHLANLWLLGGEIIRDVSVYKEYSTSAVEKLRESVRPDGGPYCRHLDGEAEIKSFDSTCRKLHKYLEDRSRQGPSSRRSGPG
jgi:hypothetical protein